ncbi:MAG: hypothetical protein RQ867_05160 [Mariprofundaceae bacterium]|nr:hypothetical protein [Mariprofundaceae bacterium]
MTYSAKHLPVKPVAGINKANMIKMITLVALTLYSGTALAGEPAVDGSLKQIMQQLGTDYSRLNHAILLEDFDAAAEAADAIAVHGKPSMGQRMKIMASLGTDMAAFKKADGAVHDLAVRVKEAAGTADMPLLIQHQSQLLSACMACHTTYRSRVAALLK